MTCAKFECAGWDGATGLRIHHLFHEVDPSDHDATAYGPECSCRCGLPWSKHSDAARGVEQPAQKAELQAMITVEGAALLQRTGFETAEYCRAEAHRQRERAEKAERDKQRSYEEWEDAVAKRDALRAELAALNADSLEQARLLGMGGEREAALMGKVERLERELASERQRSWNLAAASHNDRAGLDYSVRELAALKAQQPVAWTWIEDGVMHEPSLTRFAREPVPGATALYAAPVATVTQAEHAAALKRARWEALTEAAVVCRDRAATSRKVAEEIRAAGLERAWSEFANREHVEKLCANAIEQLRDKEEPK